MVVANGTYNLSALSMPGIENATQFLIVPEEGVPFVDQQSWLCLFDRAKDCSRGCVRCWQWPYGSLPQNVERGRLAASFFRGGNRQSWRMCEAFEGMGMYGPKYQNFRTTLGQDKVASHRIAGLFH